MDKEKGLAIIELINSEDVDLEIWQRFRIKSAHLVARNSCCAALQCAKTLHYSAIESELSTIGVGFELDGK